MAPLGLASLLMLLMLKLERQIHMEKTFLPCYGEQANASCVSRVWWCNPSRVEASMTRATRARSSASKGTVTWNGEASNDNFVAFSSCSFLYLGKQVGGLHFPPSLLLSRQDIASKIMAFSQQGPRSVCILSANGDISDVTLRQPAISGGTVTYEGRYEIISLSGSFLLTEEGGTRSRSGGLTVALAGSDGRILGGGVTGMLVAATPVQVVVGSFIVGGKKPKPEPIRKEPSPPPQILGFGVPLVASPPSEAGTSSGSPDDPGSPTNETGGNACNNTAQQHLQAAYPSLSWSHSANYFTHG
ncbi:hypothetical protein ZIOFF_057352 [Zingiber officinale]|uniref:AT-hook motif nuclear-localized protein n=1 Tax=Zingiber officinale TaxID=94328 RepID=A0A8J5KBQ3_ZINOF|nr:hypothetical protein ZIOFF_057352 [Zingiber officinale]